MTNRIAHQKIVSALPATLDADTVYFVRVGAGFDQYVTNSSGTVVAYRANAAGTTGQVQYNNNGLPAGAAKTAIDSAGNLLITVDNAPTTPSATTQVVTHTRQRAARAALAWTDAYGVSLTAQASLASQNVWLACAPSDSSNFVFTNCIFTVLNAVAKTITYAGTARDHITSKPRQGLRTTTTAGVLAYMYSTQRYFFANTSVVVTAAMAKGFTFYAEICRDDPATVVTAARAFVGVRAGLSAPTNVEPSSLIHSIGMIKRATDTNWQIYSAGASVTTPIDLGASFPCNDTTNVYQLVIHSPKNSGRVFYEVYCINTGAIAVGEFAQSNLTAAGSVGLYSNHVWITNNTTAAAADITVFYLYGDSPR
jgi:hypothetical protein